MVEVHELRRHAEFDLGAVEMIAVLIRLKRLVFFFSSRRRHTRCSRDWSSDVCSSDLSFLWNKCCHPAKEIPLSAHAGRSRRATRRKRTDREGQRWEMYSAWSGRKYPQFRNRKSPARGDGVAEAARAAARWR